MANYRQLMSDSEFLRVRERAQEIGGTTLASVQFNNQELLFSTVGLTGVYRQRVEVIDLDLRSAYQFSDAQLSEVIRLSNLKVSCDCPAFKYWGFKYIATQLDYGVLQESRYPSVRNPGTEGYVCKHLYSLLQIWNELTPSITAQFSSYLLARHNAFETFRQQQQYYTTINGLIKKKENN